MFSLPVMNCLRCILETVKTLFFASYGRCGQRLSEELDEARVEWFALVKETAEKLR